MFYTDGISLNKIKNELETLILKKRVNKIIQNDNFTFTIHFGKLNFVLSLNPNLSICYVNNKKDEVLDNINSSFLLNLRKRLLNSTLNNIKQLGFDRVLVFYFTKLNELGEIKSYSLVFEIISKNSNLILLDEDEVIVDAFKKFSLDENMERPLFKGIKYSFPKSSNKISPLNVSKELFNDFLESNGIIENIEGIGKIASKNIKTFEEFKSIMDSKISPKIFFVDEKITLATVLNIEPSNFNEVKTFDTYTDMVNFYLDYERTSSSFITLKNNLTRTVSKKAKKYATILKHIKVELENNKNFVSLKEKADIFSAEMFKFKKGDSTALCFDFYNNEPITIELDPFLNTNENLALLYKKYTKSRNANLAQTRRLNEIEDEIKYLDSVSMFIERSEDLEDLKKIKEELTKIGLVKKEKKQKQNKIKPSISYGTIDKGEYKILYGRNNIENDYLTFKIADKNDLWLHVKNIPGSHVIIKSKTYTDEIILEGAKVAVYFSKVNFSEKVTIDYTLRKNVKKISESKAGFVSYTGEKSIFLKKEDISSEL